MNESILDTIDLTQLGKRLQQARKRQGLTQEVAAKAINAARTTLTAIESGARRLKASELIKLAEVYGQDVSDFVVDRPQIEEFRVQFPSSLTRSLEDDVQVSNSIKLLQALCTNYLELEQITQKPLTYNYPPVYRYEGRRTEQAAEGLAISERYRLGLGDAPIPDLREILENHVGLRIFYIAIRPSSKFSEIYFYDAVAGGCIAINKLQAGTKGRCRWSLAHAYAHFLAHRSKATVSLDDDNQRKPESERFADSFARYFLLPTSSVMQRFNALYQTQGKVTPSDLVKFAHYYGVSFDALVLRLEEMRLIPSGVGERLKERGFKVKEAEKLLGLNEDAESMEALPKRYIKTESTEALPKRYVKLAVEAYDSAEISEGELAKYLQTDLLTAREIADQCHQQSSVDDAIDQDLLELIAA